MTFLFLVDVYLIYNILLVSGVQHSSSVIYMPASVCACVCVSSLDSVPLQLLQY